MLQILIIDDSQSKIGKISRVIEEFDSIPPENVIIAGSQIAAKRLLQDHKYDMVILDIQLPVRDDEEPQLDGGLKLLNEIHSRSRYNKPNCIIGLTAYPETVESASGEFANHLWSIVLYRDDTDGWEQYIRDKIIYMIEQQECQKEGRAFGQDIGIITALGEPEFGSVMRLIDWQEEPCPTDDTRYMSGVFSSRTKEVSAITACQTQMGMTSAAVLATKMTSHFRPKYLAMVGITAGVRDQVELGDIIVADPCWDWGSGKLVEGSSGSILKPDPLPHRLDSSMLTLFHAVQRDKKMLHDIWDKWVGNKPKQPPVLHIGPCVSGACVLADGKIVDDICEHSRKLVGIDMEAYGIMHAGAHSIKPHPLTFSMKGVSDYADKKKNDSIRDYAAYVSASLLNHIILTYL